MHPARIARKLCPRARASYIKALERGDALFAKHGITTPLRMAHFLAQAFHETGGLTVEWESGAYSARRIMEIFGVGRHSAGITAWEAEQLAYKSEQIFERVYGLGNPKKARELGNTRLGDGFRYRGGGILQTTGRANYARMSGKCGVDFEANPQLIVSPEHLLKPALAEWSAGNLNALADRDDIRAITGRINGGFNGFDDRVAWLRRIRPLTDPLELNVNAPPPPDVEPVAAPASKPTPAVRNVRTGAIAAGGIAAATQAPDPSSIAIIISAALIAALALYLIWPNKE
jgi:putative chitinase